MQQRLSDLKMSYTKIEYSESNYLKWAQWSLWMDMRSFIRRISYRSYRYACGDVVAYQMSAYWVSTLVDFNSWEDALRNIANDPQLAHRQMRWMRKYHD
jgi:hypothetical protein